MKLQQLTEIIEIANTGSFSQAARNLYASQPSLSRSVKQLEEEVGFQIFERTSRGVIPTPRGKHLLDRARAISGECEDILADCQNQKCGFRNTLHVASMQCRITSYLPPSVLKYVGTNTNVIMLNCANYAEIFNLVSTIQVDYALIQVLSTYIQSIKLKLRTMDIEYHPISRHKIAALIGPRNPLWTLESDCTEQLNPYTILSWATSKQEAKYNYAEALGFIHTALGNLQTNNPKVFFQTIHETSSVGLLAMEPHRFPSMCEYDDLHLIPITDCEIYSETAWIKLRRIPLSDIAFDSLMSTIPVL